MLLVSPFQGLTSPELPLAHVFARFHLVPVAAGGQCQRFHVCGVIWHTSLYANTAAKVLHSERNACACSPSTPQSASPSW